MNIGVFGSAFDPVTIAHLWMAKEVAKIKNLDKIILVPSSDTREDKGRKLTSNIHRITMLNIATENEPLFEINDVEMKASEEQRYTFYTLDHLKKKYPKDQLYFIIGADLIRYIPNWERSEELVKNNKFIVMPRDGYDIQEALNNQPLLVEHRENFDIIQTKVEIAISSTMIRNGIDTGNWSSYHVPLKVSEYIDKHNLYRKTDKEDKFE